jgi:hypothetical protein
VWFWPPLCSPSPPFLPSPPASPSAISRAREKERLSERRKKRYSCYLAAKAKDEGKEKGEGGACSPYFFLAHELDADLHSWDEMGMFLAVSGEL